MNESIKTLLLKIIKYSGDINPLIKLGYEYSQIINLIAIEVDEGNAQYLNGELFITEKGNMLISNLINNRKQGSESWIEPEIESKISKIDKNFIYLPNKKDLSF